MHQFNFGDIAVGTALPYLTVSSLEELELMLPPFPEQHAIAHILGTLDDKIELNRRMNETLEEMARALFKSWFVDFEPVRAKMDGRWRRGQSLPGMPAELYDLFPDGMVSSELGEIPEGWEVKPLGDVAGVFSGKRPKERYSEPLEEGYVQLWGGNGPIAFVPAPLISYPVILTGRVGTLGSVFRITSPIWPSDNTLVIRPKHPSLFEYLLHCVSLFNFESLNRGSTQPLLTQTDLLSQPILQPSSAILTRRFHETIAQGYLKCDHLYRTSTALIALRDTLLPKLISGKFRTGESILQLVESVHVK